MSNKNVEIRVDTRVRKSIKIDANQPDILVHAKKIRGITLNEVGITCQTRLMTIETEKRRKYNLPATKLGLKHRCTTKIIPYVMTWNGIITNYMILERNRRCRFCESYIQASVIKRMLKNISFEHRRGHEHKDYTNTAQAPMVQTQAL